MYNETPGPLVAPAFRLGAPGVAYVLFDESMESAQS